MDASRYYLGTVPAINPPEHISPVLATKIPHMWHIASIRLAGQIWRTYRCIVNISMGWKSSPCLWFSYASTTSPSTFMIFFCLLNELAGYLLYVVPELHQ
ncbi:hypothetical protein BDR03DRAFT_944874 [Suillus americanus]|nr:hypothetical protein BDR03DRAFT_944874 [Suillus americanus]